MTYIGNTDYYKIMDFFKPIKLCSKLNYCQIEFYNMFADGCLGHRRFDGCSSRRARFIRGNEYIGIYIIGELERINTSRLSRLFLEIRGVFIDSIFYRNEDIFKVFFLRDCDIRVNLVITVR